MRTLIAAPVYFHGGVRGLRRGDLILPPSETGARTLFDGTSQQIQAKAVEVYRRDRVYLTTHREAACLYAAFHYDGARTYGGAVYQVEPVGDVEPDLDYLADDGGSVATASARVMRVVFRKVLRAPYLEAL